MTGFAPKYDLFVFDWDGTVMDTTALIAKGIQHAAREMGYPVPSFQDACGVIGLDWRSAILKVVPDCPESEHMRFGEIYRAWYIPHEADVILFPGMRELIVGLHARGLRTAVATGKSREGLRRVFERTGLEGFFMTTQTASECLPKPNAEMLEKIGIELDVPAERTVMIGDTTHDVIMAHRYGCDAAAMTYGASTLQDLIASKPAVLCPDVRALIVIFACYLLWMIFSALKARREAGEEEIDTFPAWKCIVYIIGGAAAIKFGGDFVVDGATMVARSFGLTQTLIGLTVVAVGTSLPELVTSIVAAKKNELDMAVGNVVGSNIFNILLVLGVASSISPIAFLMENVVDIVILVGFSIVVWLMAWTKKRLSRREGIIMLLLYLGYMVYICMR